MNEYKTHFFTLLMRSPPKSLTEPHIFRHHDYFCSLFVASNSITMVYNYTKPRQPIAAMYSSPGPCYALPGLVGQIGHDPRSVHMKGPAYPFGIRHGKFQDDCSPGPCYLPDPKIYRDGRDGTPHYSLYGRHRDLTRFKVPGPGTYSPEKSGPSAYYTPPHYTFGMRHMSRKLDNIPGGCGGGSGIFRGLIWQFCGIRGPSGICFCLAFFAIFSQCN